MATTVSEILTKYVDNFTVGTLVVDAATAGAQRSFIADGQHDDANLVPGEVYACSKDTPNGQPLLVLVGKCALTLKTTIVPDKASHLPKTFSH